MGICRFRLPASGYRLSASGFRLPAIGCPLPASGCRLPAAIACWTVLPNARGFRRLRRPGSIVRALRAERWVRAGIGFAFRPGSEGSYVCRLRRHLYSSPPPAAIPQPSATQWLSNLRTLRTFGPPGPSTFTPKGRVKWAPPQPSAAKRLSPLEQSEHNPSIQPAAKPRPFFIYICGGAATTTL